MGSAPSVPAEELGSRSATPPKNAERGQTRNGGWCRHQPPLSSASLLLPVRAGKSAWADRVPVFGSCDPWPAPSRVSGAGIAAFVGPQFGSSSRRFRRSNSPFAVPRPERSGSAGRPGKWERLRLSPLPHASSSLALPLLPRLPSLRMSASSAPAMAFEAVFRFRSAASWPHKETLTLPRVAQTQSACG
jgi:hypothetical protein